MFQFTGVYANRGRDGSGLSELDKRSTGRSFGQGKAQSDTYSFTLTLILNNTSLKITNKAPLDRVLH